MKSLYISIGLIVAVAAVTAVCFFALNGILDSLAFSLEQIPTDEQALQNMSPDRHEKTANELAIIKSTLEKHNTFLCSCIPHELCRSLAEVIDSACVYYSFGEYADFASAVAAAKSKLSHIKYDEGVNLGNIF